VTNRINVPTVNADLKKMIVPHLLLVHPIDLLNVLMDLANVLEDTVLKLLKLLNAPMEKFYALMDLVPNRFPYALLLNHVEKIKLDVGITVALIHLPIVLYFL
jgi:hypothetical protein